MDASWDEVADRMKVVVPEWMKPKLQKPPAEALDAYEAATGFRLPQGYRQFVLRIGPGEFGAFTTVYGPDYPGRRSPFPHLARAGEEFRGHHLDGRTDEDVRRSWADVARVRRLHVFAKSSGGDYFGWDPLDVRDESGDGPEYGVYELPHSDPAVACVAASMLEFVEKVCLRGAGPKRRKVFSPE